MTRGGDWQGGLGRGVSYPKSGGKPEGNCLWRGGAAGAFSCPQWRGGGQENLGIKKGQSAGEKGGKG